jgi:hypothetical protein
MSASDSGNTFTPQAGEELHNDGPPDTQPINVRLD